jgi:hypothetical protein
VNAAPSHTPNPLPISSQSLTRVWLPCLVTVSTTIDSSTVCLHQHRAAASDLDVQSQCFFLLFCIHLASPCDSALVIASCDGNHLSMVICGESCLVGVTAGAGGR